MIMKDYAKPYTSKKSNLLEEIVLTFLGAVCFVATAFMFAYSVLGGLS